MTDRELLELAAKAAGIKLHHWWEDEFVPVDPNTDDAGVFWDPLTDDRDAFQLAVKLKLEIGFPDHDFVWSFGRNGSVCKEEYGNDSYAATRRAIVRAAAEIGRAM